ncbi:hypothetical protein P4525_20210, partial [Peribacillus psychrosaccharolyticus]|nr:hypothetical protein [Peribacillus psychrosaccharolyticus]
VKTPAGTAGQVRPRRSVSIDAAHRPPAESETPFTAINSRILKTKKEDCRQTRFPPEFVYSLKQPAGCFSKFFILF